MSLLLTGATGFLGRNILARALKEGLEIFAPVRNPDKLSQQLRFEQLDTQRLRVLSAAPRQWSSI